MCNGLRLKNAIDLIGVLVPDGELVGYQRTDGQVLCLAMSDSH
jgi:hypothetical protein